MEHQDYNERIIKVLSFILNKLDTLEIEQSRHKEMFYKVRRNLTDANDLINQILDVISIENPELYNETLSEYKNHNLKDMVSTLDKHILEFDDEQILELLTHILQTGEIKLLGEPKLVVLTPKYRWIIESTIP